MKGLSCCELCSHLVYDDELDYDYCEVNIDEDEMEKMYRYSKYSCPYFHYNNEYEIVNKQI